MTTVRSKPELLCPAGDWEAMRAAVANGADAVYFGLDQFNARHRAKNFRLDELPDVMRYLHRHNVRGFVTFNTLIFSGELDGAAEYLKQIATAGVDAIIVQDLGIAELAHRVAPTLEVHGSTQMTLTEPRGIEFVRKLGVCRVVVARELSVADIGKITAATDMPLEVFVHGALCVAYSGQCLTSESLGGRSANRGQCAQACRMPYDLIVDGKQKAIDISYLVSPTDLAAYDLIGDLSNLGVASFKIEGRLKDAHYVAMTAQTYRAAIDGASRQSAVDNRQQDRSAADRGLPTADQLRDLNVVYSRGFTHGFLDGTNHQQLVPGQFPKARGLRVGRFVQATRRGFVIELDRGMDASVLKNGDGIVFDEGHPEQDEAHGQIYRVEPWGAPVQKALRHEGTEARRGRQAARGFARADSRGAHLPDSPTRRLPDSPTSRRIHIELGNHDADPDSVEPGAIVWKNSDPALSKRLEQTWARDRVVHRVPIDLTLVAHVHASPILIASDGTREVEATVDHELVAAEKHPISEEFARRQLDRLMDTPFALRSLKLESTGGPMVPASILADLRRDAVEKLFESREAAAKHAIAEPDALEKLRGVGGPPTSDRRSEADSALRADLGETPKPQLHVLARTMEQVEALTKLPAELRPASIYCDFEDVRRYSLAVPVARAAGIPIAVATMRVIKPGEEGWLRHVLNCNPDQIIVRNLAGIGYYQEVAPHLPLIGDFSLNIANELTAAIFARAGLIRMVPSYDLSWNQMAEMFAKWKVGERGEGPGARGEDNASDADAAPARRLTDSPSTDSSISPLAPNPSPLSSAPSPLPFECVVHQHMPMFHMEHCVFARVLSNGKDYRDCGRPCEKHHVDLREQVGKQHALIPDAGCRNTLFNGEAQSAMDYIPRMKALGVTHFRVELLRQPAGEVEHIVRQYADVLHGRSEPTRAVRSLRVLSQLGVTRGTFQRE